MLQLSRIHVRQAGAIGGSKTKTRPHRRSRAMKFFLMSEFDAPIGSLQPCVDASRSRRTCTSCAALGEQIATGRSQRRQSRKTPARRLHASPQSRWSVRPLPGRGAGKLSQSLLHFGDQLTKIRVDWLTRLLGGSLRLPGEVVEPLHNTHATFDKSLVCAWEVSRRDHGIRGPRARPSVPSV